MVTAPDRASYVHELAATFEAGLRRLSELPVPVVAAVHGAVACAGLAVVLNCDVVIAARSTKFLMAYSAVGLTPDCGVSYLLPRAVGQQRALELALTGRTLSAEEAMAWGLVAACPGRGRTSAGHRGGHPGRARCYVSTGRGQATHSVVVGVDQVRERAS
jgi:enoyl-CoA hydratase/carnithine racemase